MDRKPWKTWSVSKNTQTKWALLSYSQTIKRLIHKHRYDSAHVCVKEKERDPQVLSGGFTVLWAAFYDDDPRFMSLKGSILTGGHAAIFGLVCPSLGVATAIATPFLIRWPFNTPGPPGQLSAQFSFQILVLLAHCPHTDLIVDHIDPRMAVEAKPSNTLLDGPMNRVHPGARIHLLPAVGWQGCLSVLRLLGLDYSCECVETAEKQDHWKDAHSFNL